MEIKTNEVRKADSFWNKRQFIFSMFDIPFVLCIITVRLHHYVGNPKIPKRIRTRTSKYSTLKLIGFQPNGLACCRNEEWLNHCIAELHYFKKKNKKLDFFFFHWCWHELTWIWLDLWVICLGIAGSGGKTERCWCTKKKNKQKQKLHIAHIYTILLLLYSTITHFPPDALWLELQLTPKYEFVGTLKTYMLCAMYYTHKKTAMLLLI